MLQGLAHVVIGDQNADAAGFQVCATRWRISPTEIGSTPANGSSSRRYRGLAARQRAISTRRRSPPESAIAGVRRRCSIENSEQFFQPLASAARGRARRSRGSPGCCPRPRGRGRSTSPAAGSRCRASARRYIGRVVTSRPSIRTCPPSGISPRWRRTSSSCPSRWGRAAPPPRPAPGPARRRG